MDETRQVTGPKPCPRCGAGMVITEQAQMVAEIDHPVAWAPIRRACIAGCLLTVEDFPADYDT